MRRLILAPLILFLSSSSGRSLNAAEIDPKVHKACLAAIDFQGCIRAYTEPVIKIESVDFLGRPPIKGWRAWEDRSDNSIYYVDHNNVNKVKVRNLYGRYIQYQYVKRWYQEAVAGTPGYQKTIGSATTTCVENDSGPKTCTTTPAQTKYVPGEKEIIAGVYQDKSVVIIDCLDRTGKWIKIKTSLGDQHSKKWKSIERKMLTQQIADENCSIINSLSPSNYMKWAKGTPKEDDFFAIKVLPNSTPQLIRNLKRP